jgi:RecA/RadA recombinase
MKRSSQKLSVQRKVHAEKKVKKKEPFEGNTDTIYNTGSTLLDLAISGTRIRGGGILGGILVEIAGKPGSGKTVLLVETAGDAQRKEKPVMFRDPEARLNKLFAQIFDLQFDSLDYATPDTVTQLFQSIRAWDIDPKVGGACFADSLAALSTEMEMEKEEGDKMGMRRAKEFSEELRRTCRILQQKNILLLASNQLRVNQDAGMFGQKYVSPGGEAIGFYSSLRLRFTRVEKINEKKSIKGKSVTKVVGTKATIEVAKSSIDMPFRTAEIYIYFDYGIDDIRANLQFIKDFGTSKKYSVNDTELDISMNKSIAIVEKEGLEQELKEQVIDLWEFIQTKFESNRKKKKR